MRKALSIFLALLTAFTLFACGTGANVEKEENSSEATDNPTENIASTEESSSVEAEIEEDPSGLPDDPTEDLISVEEFSIDKHGWRHVKVRNVSGKTIPWIICDYVFIDENGDIIDTRGLITSSQIMIEDGQAFIEQDQITVADGDYSKIAMVRFTTYTLRDVLNGEFRWVKEYSFIDAPEFIRNSDGTFSKYSETDKIKS